jgi:hypothetical protein
MAGAAVGTRMADGEVMGGEITGGEVTGVEKLHVLSAIGESTGIRVSAGPEGISGIGLDFDGAETDAESIAGRATRTVA